MSIPLLTPLERARFVRDRLPAERLFAEKTWRVAPEPLVLSPAHHALLGKLGLVLHHFNKACNLLYRQSAAGKAHPWVASLLDAGKPAELVALGRHDKTKGQVAAVIRPDLIVTETGFALSEIDSVPGGIGLTQWLNETYAALGEQVVGGAEGMRQGFAAILGEGDVVISEESATYRPEIEWVAGANRVHSVENYAATGKPLYRFFEAFDFLKLDRFRSTWQPGQPLTAPLKPYLEEKLWLALFWSRPLQAFWRQEIGENGQRLLQQIIPYSWVLDPAPLPPHAVIPELNIQIWRELGQFSQKQRELVLKVSGFSPLAWGSRGVQLGSDRPTAQWIEEIEQALTDFPEHPRLLQRFVKGGLLSQKYLEGEETLRLLTGRVRLCPYYFVEEERVTLGGAMSTLCPSDKKLLHGMRDAIISPLRQAPQ